MNFATSLENEIGTFNEILGSVPFMDVTPKSNFLRIYHLNYKELNKYVQNNPFPLDSNKLLKLCISLGNLIKSLQLDEEMYYSQQEQEPATHDPRITPVHDSKRSSMSSNPFQSPKHYIQSQPQGNQPSYQVKFIKNLLIILKNFDIGYVNKDLVNSHNSGSSTTLNQHLNSPIKLNSKQLLIEKLEININLDILFIFHTLLKVLIQIFSTLKEHLIQNQDLDVANTTNESSSIFSSNSNNSISSDSLITYDEYIKLLNQILNRVSTGLTEPFLKYMMNFVSGNISNEFKALITSL